MTLQASGAISLANIAAEFGSGAAPHSITEYYAGGTNVPAGTNGYPSGVTTPIPSSGQIKFSNFYGAALAVAPSYSEVILVNPNTFVYNTASRVTVTGGTPNTQATYIGTDADNSTITATITLDANGNYDSGLQLLAPQNQVETNRTWHFNMTFAGTGHTVPFSFTSTRTYSEVVAMTPSTFAVGTPATLSVSGGQAGGTFTYTNNHSGQVFGPLTLDSSGNYSQLNTWVTNADQPSEASHTYTGAFNFTYIGGGTSGPKNISFTATRATVAVSHATSTGGAGATSVDEGGTVTFNIQTTNVAAGTKIYYGINTYGGLAAVAADFTSPNFTDPAACYVTVAANGTASFTATVASDLATEGSNIFTIGFWYDASHTQWITESTSITINDTSVALPVVTLTAVSTSVVPNDLVRLRVTGATIGTTLHITMANVSGITTGCITNLNQISVTQTEFDLTYATTSSFPVSASPRIVNFQLRTTSTSGPIVATSANVTFSDSVSQLAVDADFILFEVKNFYTTNTGLDTQTQVISPAIGGTPVISYSSNPAEKQQLLPDGTPVLICGLDYAGPSEMVLLDLKNYRANFPTQPLTVQMDAHWNYGGNGTVYSMSADAYVNKGGTYTVTTTGGGFSRSGGTNITVKSSSKLMPKSQFVNFLTIEYNPVTYLFTMTMYPHSQMIS